MEQKMNHLDKISSRASLQSSISPNNKVKKRKQQISSESYGSSSESSSSSQSGSSSSSSSGRGFNREEHADWARGVMEDLKEEWREEDDERFANREQVADEFESLEKRLTKFENDLNSFGEEVVHE